ncbi:DUF3757 domain-containing protein [Legionella worsleiensis]|uniref:DUF3757 domain-containing protein n=1 Tax=Legionella worsleiensis TaxID=45076 RepID=A0A0W1A3H6_9GAMM|nr:DUF3757 domain-containing protein [Legionella worsleiensis]KTD75921.1 hypothetical protein Lwor_2487 [Legionella worsleiensis]STY32934.1 Protein of uncharacterised function (DUF3757) [Legionella worsleiensis]
MKKCGFWVLGTVLLAQSFSGFCTQCPDPDTTSLRWGVPPSPWVENPFSVNKPQGEENTRFVKANILVASYGQGVTCTYRNSVGDYSIWWQILTKIPARTDNNWIDTLGGYVCTQGLTQCEFYVADTSER